MALGLLRLVSRTFAARASPAGKTPSQYDSDAPVRARRERRDREVVLHAAHVDVNRVDLSAREGKRERLRYGDAFEAPRPAQRLREGERTAGTARSQDHHLAVLQERCARLRERHLGERGDGDEDDVGIVHGVAHVGCDLGAATVTSPRAPVRRRTPASRIGATTASKAGRSKSVHAIPRRTRSAAIAQPPLPAPSTVTRAGMSAPFSSKRRPRRPAARPPYSVMARIRRGLSTVSLRISASPTPRSPSRGRNCSAR